MIRFSPAMAELTASVDGGDLHRGLRDMIFEAGDLKSLSGKLAALSKDHAFMTRLHGRQHWQLQRWQEASEHLSYRRFFEVTGLVGLRVEDIRVFEESHRLVLDLVRQGQVQGLRIDHIDGLAEPRAYLDRLREAVGADTYIVVEKILGAGEEFPADWPVQGTTGYEFITALGGLFVDGNGLQKLDEAYRRLADGNGDFEAGRRTAKRLMVEQNFAGEAARLARIAAGLFPELSMEEITGAICRASDRLFRLPHLWDRWPARYAGRGSPEESRDGGRRTSGLCAAPAEHRGHTRRHDRQRGGSRIPPPLPAALRPRHGKGNGGYALLSLQPVAGGKRGRRRAGSCARRRRSVSPIHASAHALPALRSFGNIDA